MKGNAMERILPRAARGGMLLAAVLCLAGCKTEVDEPEQAGPSPVPGGTGEAVSGAVTAKQFFWGTWQRMDNGVLYEIDENAIRSLSTYTSSAIVSCSETELVTERFGTFSRDSDRVLRNGTVPYFRQGGTNLAYTLRLVGLEQNISRAATSFSGLKVSGTSERFSSYREQAESDSNGTVVLHAPVRGDVQTVTIERNDGSVIVTPGIKIENTNSNMGVIPVAGADEYILKVTGTIMDGDKTGGYLYGDGYKTYPLTLTITNVSNVESEPSVCAISPADSVLSVTATDGSNIDGTTIPTMKAGRTQSFTLEVRCGTIDGAYIDTGLNVTVTNLETGKSWVDFVPLRFYKGLVPVTVAAKNPTGNTATALNGFAIYPDGNSQFFTVAEAKSKTLYLPSFPTPYTLVFSGATVQGELSNSTEMYYTVAPGSTEKKTVVYQGSVDVLREFYQYGEPNGSEDSATKVTEAFEAYLSDGDIDFYTVPVSTAAIVPASKVSESDLNATSIQGDSTQTESGQATTTDDGWTQGMLTSNKSTGNVHYFWAKAGTYYTINWRDKGSDATYSAPIAVSAGTRPTAYGYSSSGVNTYSLFLEVTGGYAQGLTVPNDGYVFITVRGQEYGYVYRYTGSYALQVKQNDKNVTLFSYNEETFAPAQGVSVLNSAWTSASLSNGGDYILYRFPALKGNTYNVYWDDCADGSGRYTADVEVATYTTLGTTAAGRNDSGWSQSSLVYPAGEYGYVRVRLKGGLASNRGTYAVAVMNGSTGIPLTQVDAHSDSYSAAAYEPSVLQAWTTGSLSSTAKYSDAKAYTVYRFWAQKGVKYRIFVDDAYEGSGKYTANVQVSAGMKNGSFQLSNGSTFFVNDYGGYGTGHPVEPKADGWVFVKVGLWKSSVSYVGTYALRVLSDDRANNTLYVHTDPAAEAYSVTEAQSAAWTRSDIYRDGHVLLSFPVQKGGAYAVRWNDAGEGNGNRTGDVEVSAYASSALGELYWSEDSGYEESSVRAILPHEDGTAFLRVQLKDSTTAGNFAVAVVSAGSAVQPTVVFMANAWSVAFGGAQFPQENWSMGTLDSGEARDVYSFEAKAGRRYNIYFDSKTSGSGTYSGTVQLAGTDSATEPAQNDYLSADYVDYTYPMTWWFTEGATAYLHVIPLDGLAGNAGTYAIAVMDGTEPVALRRQ